MNLLVLRLGSFEAHLIDYGAALTHLFVPDQHGNRIDIVAGFNDPKDYVTPSNPYLGAICGRVCNRLAFLTRSLMSFIVLIRLGLLWMERTMS
jgi:galactose mutarotase-like enzyme